MVKIQNFNFLYSISNDAWVEIIHRVTSPKSEDEIFRPSIDDDDYIVINELWREALQKCWEEKPKKRIGFHEIHEIASSLQK